jgi:hypothetical protein
VESVVQPRPIVHEVHARSGPTFRGCLRARASRLAALIAVLAATVLLAGSTPAHATYRYGRFTFDKNPADPTNSTLTWSVYEDDSPIPVKQRVWRAGSGDGTSRDECAPNHGWLPSGWYTVTFHPRYDHTIKGVALQLDDKTCGNGKVRRTELFVHSEMNADGGQGCPAEPRCWDGDRDYRSEGCIKLHPDDVKAAAEEFTRLYAPETTYDSKLHVVD